MNVPTDPIAVPGRLPWREALRADLQRETPDATLERRVRAAMAQASLRAARPGAVSPGGGQPRGAVRGTRSWAWAAGALVAVWLWGSPILSLLEGPARPSRAEPALAAPPPGLASGFVPVAAADQWRALEGGATTAWLVPTELPRERLGLLGLPYDPARAGETVRAELLMHGSGVVLAVRVAGP